MSLVEREVLQVGYLRRRNRVQGTDPKRVCDDLVRDLLVDCFVLVVFVSLETSFDRQ